MLRIPALLLGRGRRRWRERRDVAGLAGTGRGQRQHHRHRGALVDPARHHEVAAVERDQRLHDRQAKPGALVTALIGLAGLEERIADPLQIVGGDADAGVDHAQRQMRPFHRGRHRDGAAAFGELDGVGNQIEHDLLEGAQIAVHLRQIVGRAGDEVDAVVARLQRQQIAAIHQRRPRRDSRNWFSTW